MAITKKKKKKILEEINSDKTTALIIIDNKVTEYELFIPRVLLFISTLDIYSSLAYWN